MVGSFGGLFSRLLSFIWLNRLYGEIKSDTPLLEGRRFACDTFIPNLEGKLYFDIIVLEVELATSQGMMSLTKAEKVCWKFFQDCGR